MTRLDVVPGRVDIRATSDQPLTFTVRRVDGAGDPVDWAGTIAATLLRRPRRGGAPENVVTVGTVTVVDDEAAVSFPAAAINQLVSAAGAWTFTVDGATWLDGAVSVLPRGTAGGTPTTGVITVTVGSETVVVTAVGSGGGPETSQDTTHVPDPGLDPSFFPMLVPGGRQAIAAMSPPGTRSAGRVVNGELELPPMPVAQIIDGGEPIGMAIAAAGLVANKWNFPWVRTIAVTNPSTSASMIVTRPTISASWLTDATNLSICTIITDWGDASVIPATTTYQPDPPGPWFDLDPAFTPSRRDTMGGFTDVINPSPGGAPDWVNGHITGWQNGRQSHAETLRAPVGCLLPGETQNFTVVLAVGVPAAGATGTFIVGDVLFSGFALSV